MILYLGDAKEKLKRVLPNSVDAVVTDPPYGLSFMGKKWDYDVPTTELWREVFRVLKPGGHLLSFFGTRTYHRGVVRIEDAGFEIRDQVMWIYGSGFPKSTNVALRIDKELGAATHRGQGFNVAGQNVQLNQNKELRSDHPNYKPPQIKTDEAKRWQGWGTALKPAIEIVCMARKPLTDANLLDNLARECLSLLFASIARKYLASSRKGFDEASNIARWLAGESTLTQEDLSDLMATLQSESEKNSSLNIELSWLSTLDEISNHASTFTIETASSLTTDLKILKSCLLKNTQASTLQSDGPGEQSSASLVGSLLSALALKLNFILEHSAQDLATSQDEERALRLNPDSNPIVLARKPLEKGLTVAENVLKWGCGAINVDAGRIAIDAKEGIDFSRVQNGNIYGSSGIYGKGEQKQTTPKHKENGRWPANLILDEAAAEMLDAQSGILKSGAMNGVYNNTIMKGKPGERDGKAIHLRQESSAGDASRFFYVAKASKRERNAGLEGMPEREKKTLGNYVSPSEGLTASKSRAPAANRHPTVKPIKLMEYLCKLITPPNGVVLDPFMGSGSTGVACKNLGFNFIGIELNEDYFEIAKRRIENAEGKCLEVSNG